MSIKQLTRKFIGEPYLTALFASKCIEEITYASSFLPPELVIPQEAIKMSVLTAVSGGMWYYFSDDIEDIIHDVSQQLGN